MLSKLICREALFDLSGSRVFQRGEAYFNAGAVERLLATDDKISAVANGTRSYRVELWQEDDDLEFDCTCPHAASGNFCKHCVAVGLAWLAGKDKGGKGGRPRRAKKNTDPWRLINEYLDTLPRKEMQEMLLQVALRDEQFYRALELQAARSGNPESEVKAFRRAITSVTRVHGFVDWRHAGSFARNIDQVVDGLEELLKPESAASLVKLAEYGIERTEKALMEIDDSSGSVGEVVRRLGELHLKACRKARPEGKDLAARLFRLETTLPFGLCRFDPFTYQQVLGKEGMTRYRELAEAEWRKIEPCGKGEKDFDSHRFNITSLMESLAKADGDIEKLVEIKSRDLSSGYCYLEIAEILKKAGQSDEALGWAERGLDVFAERPDNRLRDFLVGEYLKRKRFEEALQLTWVQFAERANLGHYRKLKAVSDTLDIWPAQRQRALARVEELIASQTGKISRLRGEAVKSNYSLRLEIALWEKDFDAAWDATRQGICNRDLLIDLAGKLEGSRPQDAVHLYQLVVTTFVEQTNNDAYREAVELIGRIGRLLRASKMTAQFESYKEELGARFKAKRNFIKFLKELR